VLSEQLLFVDAAATIDQYNIFLRGPLTSSNVNTTGNRTTASTFLISPYLVQEFGSDIRGEARYTYSLWNSDDTTSLSSSDANRIDMTLVNSPEDKLLSWDLAYTREIIDYEGFNDTDSEVVTGNARRLITPTLGLLAQVGYENYDYRVLGASTGGASWSAGVEWTPSARTRLAASAGERFYGDAYSLEFSHRTRLTTWSAGYSEEVSSTRSQFFLPATSSTAGYLDSLFLSQFPDPVARQEAVEDFMAQTGLSQQCSDRQCVHRHPPTCYGQPRSARHGGLRREQHSQPDRDQPSVELAHIGAERLEHGCCLQPGRVPRYGPHR
jgi:uncharacterized protein (PEP-CTERM system associated)